MSDLNAVETPQPYVSSFYRILYFAPQTGERVIDLPADEYQINISDNATAPFEALGNEPYDLVVLDDELFGDTSYMIIMELKRWDLSLPVIVLTNQEEVIYQTNLMEAGADDILVKSYSQEYLGQRLKLCLKRNEQDRKFIQANRKLYEIMLLTRQLHAFTDPQALIEATIQLVCNTFNLYGIAVAIPEDGIMRVYSGHGSEQEATVVMQSLRDQKPNEPLARSIETGIIELFDDISRDPNYMSLPNLLSAQSSLIIPLRHQADTLGAIAIFGNLNNPLDPDALRTYEILATQFAVALQNAYFSQAQHDDIRTSHMLLKGWQNIFSVETAEDIAKTLCNLVSELPGVDEAMVWISESEGEALEVYSTGKYDSAPQLLADLLNQGDLLDSIRQANHDSHTIFKFGLSPNDPLQPLFRALHSRQLIFTPIEDSARFIGGILISGSGDRRFDLEDANRVKNLSLVAGQALERIMLIEAMMDKSVRLEAILRSVTEGIFFVDDNGQVAFCNPQVTELTNVNPSEIMWKQPEVLLNLLADQATDPEKATADLYDAVRSLQTTPGPDHTYPIVELTLRDSGHPVDIEFIAVDDFRASRKSWVGLVHLNARANSKWEAPQETIDLLVRTLHLTNMDLQQVIGRRTTGNSRQSLADEKSILGEIQKSIGNSEVLLEQYSHFNNFDLTVPEWSYETVDLGELLNEIVRVHFSDMQDRILNEATAGRFCVEADKQLVERGLLSLLENIVRRAPGDELIPVRMKDTGDEIFVRIESSGVRDLPDSELTLSHLVESDDPDYSGEDIYIYHALLQFYHCRIWIETVANKDRSLLISFPKTQATYARALPQTDTLFPEAVAARTPRREPEAVMVIQGRSAITKKLTQELEREGFGLFNYRSAEEALRDINLTRLDLIVLDGNLLDEDSAEVCRKIHNRSEVPIVIVADKAANLERVEALKVGAEDYITEPISKEELLAKINVLFKRQHLLDRTEQPLELGDLRIDFARRAVFVNHKAVILTRIEYDLLRTLVVNMGQVLTHQQLLEKVWGPEHRSETQYLWVHLSRLRKKLEPTSYIHNQQGIGYIFQKP